MVACARCGASYTASTISAALAECFIDIAVIARAYHRAIESVSIEFPNCALSVLPASPTSHSGLSRASASLARQKRSATTATASPSLTTWRTPRTAERRRRIHALERAAEDRAGGNRRIDHARDLRIDGELGRAVDLERRVEAGNPLADQLELIGSTDRRLLVELDLARIGGQSAVIENTAARLVRDLLLLAASHSDGGTFQRCAAAAISRSRALAPACNSICHDVRTPRLPTVVIGP